MILCCSGRRLDFEEVVSLLASVSFVTAIAGLLSGACPETEYVYDYGTGLACRTYFMVAQFPISFNSTASLQRRQLRPHGQGTELQIMC